MCEHNMCAKLGLSKKIRHDTIQHETHSEYGMTRAWMRARVGFPLMGLGRHGTACWPPLLTHLALGDSHKIANGWCPSPSAHPAHTANSPFAASFRSILVINLSFATALCQIIIVADLRKQASCFFFLFICRFYMYDWTNLKKMILFEMTQSLLPS